VTNSCYRPEQTKPIFLFLSFLLICRPGETLEDKYNQPELFPEEVAQMEAEREEKGLHRKKERREGGDKDDDIETKVKEKKKAPLVPVNAQILPGFVGAMEWESLPPIPGLSVTLPTNKS
jgi:hypothetical protein